MQHASGTNQLQGMWIPVDGLLKTGIVPTVHHFGFFAVLRAHNALQTPYTWETLNSIRRALEWIMRADSSRPTSWLSIGFTVADLQPARRGCADLRQ